MNELTQHTIDYLNSADLGHRKSLGQYFTNSKIRNKLWECLERITRRDFNKEDVCIWEPSAGTGEFVGDLISRYPNAQIVASELDEQLCNLLKVKYPKVQVKPGDLLANPSKEAFDLIPGNPPYFEINLDHFLFKQEEFNKWVEEIQPKGTEKDKKKEYLTQQRKNFNKKYKDVISGRVNIYSLFIKVGLDALKPKGYLAFVVPPSMNNGAYFKKLREYICLHAEIKDIILFSENEFADAQQTVMILILRKHEKPLTKIPEDMKFVFQKGDILIFTTEAEEIKKAFEGKTTFKEQGWKVVTGNVVWNQHKPSISKHSDNKKGGEEYKKHTTLIWGQNIKSDDEVDTVNVEFKHPKGQYINLDSKRPGASSIKPFNQKAILVNRIVGTVGSGRIRAAAYSTDAPFVAENHVNVILPPKDFDVKVLHQICGYLRSEATASLIQKITGNVQISKTELENLIPMPVELFPV